MSEIIDSISPANKPESESSEEERPKEQKWFERYKSVPPFFSATFAGLAFVISCFACYFSYQQMINSRESNRIANRAYISIKSVTPKRLPLDGKFEANVQFVNNGRTPAYSIRTFRAGEAGGTGIDDNEFNTAEETKGVENLSIGASIDFSITVESDKVLGQDWVEAIKNGRNNWFVYGKCTYYDIFGEPHFTRFCFRFVSGKNVFEVSGKYNDAN